jgi:ribosomal protein S12 methylthiotransferase
MRGKHRTEPLERLVREAQQLEAQGAQEINLVAQDLGHYGRDLGRTGPTLPDLLEALLRETSVSWFRLLYVYSAGLSERLVDLVARESRIVPYIDMPIQHANDRMLERMRRPERQDTLRRKLAWLRETIPLSRSGRRLVGFPARPTRSIASCWDFSRRHSSIAWARSRTVPRRGRALRHSPTTCRTR